LWPVGAVIALFMLCALSAGRALGSEACVPPPGFVDVPPPPIAAVSSLVSHTEHIEIDQPLSVVLDATNRPLKDILHQTSSLPGVVGDHPLTPNGFDLPGSRRMVCLTDGSTLEEQVLEKRRDPTSYQVRYEVWNYTTEKARPIAYAIGEFHFNQIDPRRTRIVWTYSFALRSDRFPGYLGSFGDFLFMVGFLDRQYAELMRGTLEGYKTVAGTTAESTSAQR
jgi:hypothetical protein